MRYSWPFCHHQVRLTCWPTMAQMTFHVVFSFLLEVSNKYLSMRVCVCVFLRILCVYVCVAHLLFGFASV